MLPFFPDGFAGDASEDPEEVDLQAEDVDAIERAEDAAAPAPGGQQPLLFAHVCKALVVT